MIPGIGENTIDVNSMVDLWLGKVDQRILGPSAAAPLAKPKDNSS